MHQKIGKKIFIYFFFLILLGTINNLNLNKFNYPKILDIKVFGLGEKNNLDLKNEFNILKSGTIFFLNRDLDFIFLILNYSGFNIIFYLYIKYFQNRYYRNLLTYNIIFAATYFLYKYFLIYFFSAPVAIWSISFTNFLGHLNMFVSGDGDIVKSAFKFESLFLYAEVLIINLKNVFLKYFFSFSFQSILVWINLISFLFLLAMNG